MNRLQYSQTTAFVDLALEQFDAVNFSVYVLDHEWNYMFVNKFVQKNLDLPVEKFIGRNIWQLFPVLLTDPSFVQLKVNMEKKLYTNIVTISPITSQRIDITGQPLLDCNLFTSSILPKKEDLINELRNELPKWS